ncbi:MAG: CehA/McbA family metallohydrolase [Clostridia bacterium]|nr:CehA/McbA family metallohydrolase [Clostridia bacterium]
MEFRNYFHTPAALLLRGEDITLQLLLSDDDADSEKIELSYAALGNEENKARVRMLPVDGYRAEESYTVFSATVPSTALCGDTLQYSFFKGTAESVTYTVALADPAILPSLVITETSLWPCVHPYVELQNLTEQAIDLANYELLMRRLDGVLCRNALADTFGENIIPAGGLAAVNLVKEHVAEEEREAAKAAVLEKLCDRYPEISAELADVEPLLYFATLSVPKKEDGTPHAERRFGFERSLYGAELFVVPRGGSVDDAVYTVRHRFDEEHREVRCRLATLWQFSLQTPREGRIVTAHAIPTPGFGDRKQTACNLADRTVPTVLPVSPASRALLADGDILIRFAVVGGSDIGNATVFVREGDRFLPHIAYQNDEGLFEYAVPFEDAAYMKDALQYYIEVQGGLYAARLGSENVPFVVSLVDNNGPEVLFTTPAAYQVLENEQLPQISIAYHDISGVNTRISVLCLDGLNVSDRASWSEELVTFVPAEPLDYGTHTMEITLRDTRGNRTYHKWDFAIGDGKEMNLYCGQVHSHTADSDGKGTPEQAFAYARDVSHMDYFAITDHSSCYDRDTYARQIKLANGSNAPGKFATLYGFEMTWHQFNGFWGHTNLLNTKWACYNAHETDLDAFNKMVAEHPEGIAMFNHPGDTWGNSDDFRPFGGNMKDMYALVEVNGARHHAGYALALSRGWRVCPVLNEDNHHADWGDSGGMGYVLAPALTRENILDGMRRRRTYSTTDRTMQVRYRVNGAWLGSVLEKPERLDVEVEVTTENEGGIGKLELLTEDRIVAAVVDAGPLCEFRWHVELNPDFDYYYLRITNGSFHTVTAPIFIEGRDLLNIKRMSYGISEDAEYPHVVTATVKNESDKPISDVTVDFYLTNEDAFVLRQLAPFEEVHIGKLAPGEVHTVSRRFPDVGGYHRVSAVVSGMVSKQRYADTSYVMISPLSITKLMPLTSDTEREGATVKNPYAYIELYNHTASPITLDGYSLGVWQGTGERAIPAESRVLALNGMTVPPASTLTVWVKGENNPLTVADFNAHYGVELLEGEDLIVTDQLLLGTSNDARKLDVRRGEEILSRVTFGYHCTHDTDIVCDKPLCYAIAPNDTVKENHLSLGEEQALPLPGKLLPAQTPRTLNGLCRKRETLEAERSATRKEVFTRLTKASLVPFRAAAFVANAVSAFKGFFDTKE